MRKNLFIFSLLTFCLVTFTSCNKEKNTSVEAPQNTNATNILKIDTANSKIEWKGFKIFKSENTSHLGVIKFSQGELTTLADGVLVGATLTADMLSIENLDLTDTESKTKLENHLKSDDFFAVEKFPTAKIEIKNIIPSNEGDYNSILEGNLTIKNTTKPIKINANVVYNDQQVSIFTEPTELNRKDFNIEFQSPIENGIIKDEIEVQAIIKANIQ